MPSLYRSSTRGPEDDSVESKHVAPLSLYMFDITTVVFDGTSPPFYFTNTSGWNTSSSNVNSHVTDRSRWNIASCFVLYVQVFF